MVLFNVTCTVAGGREVDAELWRPYKLLLRRIAERKVSHLTV